MTKEPVISVITTIYNTEKLFDRCYQSILKQTYKSIQFIIVNNGSQGDIDENIDKYISSYNNYDIRYVKLEENVGLYHGRLKGAEVATGEYIAFIDSDDRVSIDYYRMMVHRAHKSQYDIVISDFVYENENNELTYDLFNYIQGYEFELEGNNIFETFYKQEAHSFFWNLIWNKVYSMELWKRAKVFLKENTNKIVMCDDIIYTFVLFFHANKILKIKNNYYYYYKHSIASSNPTNIDKTLSILEDIINVFNYCQSFIRKMHYNEDSLIEWKKRYARLWINFIKYSKFSFINKNKLIKKLEKELANDIKLDVLKTEDDFICIRDNNRIKFNNDLEIIKEQLIDDKIKVVSFDIFDTLLVRHVWEPHDLFYFLDFKFIELYKLNINIEFHKIRSYCEYLARERAKINGIQEITLDDIYNEIYYQYGYEKDLLDKIKTYEMDLELQLCSKREMLYNIYEMCMYLQKEVVYISDMYLPENFIYKLLDKNQYSRNNQLFISSTHKITKSTSKLYSYVLEKMNISNREIIHIGDNWDSDIIKSQSVGIKSIFIPRTIDAYTFADYTKSKVREQFIDMYYNNSIGINLTLFSNIGSRCLVALAINKYLDNPYMFVHDSYSGMNIYYLGYHILGLYIFAGTNWVKQMVNDKKYDKILFLSRDGYIIKKAFDILFKGYNSNYFYASRRSLLALSLRNKEDILGLPTYVYFMDYSPKKIINIFQNSLKYSYEKSLVLCQESGIKTDVNFISKEEFDKFLYIFKNEIFSEENNQIYREKMKDVFKKYFEKNSVTFDIGYSGRTESILNGLLGYQIDALYLYKNYNRSEINSKINKFNILNCYDYFPNINEEIILELFISETGQSCKYYEIENNELKFIFDNKISQNYITKYFIDIMQNGALKFIQDVGKHFGSLLETNFYYNQKDLEYPLKYYIYLVPKKEFSYLDAAIFEDSIAYGKIIKINEVLTYARGNFKYYGKYFDINNEKNRIKRLVYFSLFERNILKRKVHEKTKNNYLLNRSLRFIYRTLKNIYYLFFKK